MRETHEPVGRHLARGSSRSRPENELQVGTRMEVETKTPTERAHERDIDDARRPRRDSRSVAPGLTGLQNYHFGKRSRSHSRPSTVLSAFHSFGFGPSRADPHGTIGHLSAYPTFTARNRNRR